MFVRDGHRGRHHDPLNPLGARRRRQGTGIAIVRRGSREKRRGVETLAQRLRSVDARRKVLRRPSNGVPSRIPPKTDQVRPQLIRALRPGGELPLGGRELLSSPGALADSADPEQKEAVGRRAQAARIIGDHYTVIFSGIMTSWQHTRTIATFAGSAESRHNALSDASAPLFPTTATTVARSTPEGEPACPRPAR